MPKKSQVLALLELGWSYRRIEAETGVRRETVSRYDRMRRSNAAKTFPALTRRPCRILQIFRLAASQMRPNVRRLGGKSGQNVPRLAAASAVRGGPLSRGDHREARCRPEPAADLPGRRRGVRLRRELRVGEAIRADARADAASGGGRISLRPGAGVCVQVDFFRGAPTLHAAAGECRRPRVFRMTLDHSRHDYEEAAWDQKLETFLRLDERAFRDFGGVPRVVRHDDLKVAVVRAGFYDPDSGHDVFGVRGALGLHVAADAPADAAGKRQSGAMVGSQRCRQGAEPAGALTCRSRSD
jgi:hypothetical protein